MDGSALLDRYRQASDDTRRMVDRLLQDEDDDLAWTSQLGPVYRQADVAVLLRKSKQAVSQDRRLLRLEMRSGTIGYPVFQFDGRAQVPGVAEVVEILTPAVATSWTVASWLTSPLAPLEDRRPIDVLRSRGEREVAAAARSFAAALQR